MRNGTYRINSKSFYCGCGSVYAAVSNGGYAIRCPQCGNSRNNDVLDHLQPRRVRYQGNKVARKPDEPAPVEPMKNTEVEQTVIISRGDLETLDFHITPLYNGHMQAPVNFGEQYTIAANSNWQYPHKIVNEHGGEIWLTDACFIKVLDWLKQRATPIENQQ